MNSKAYDQVYALSLLSACRKANVIMVSDDPINRDNEDEQAEALAAQVRPEVRNIVLEHLTNEQLVDLMAEVLTSEAGQALGKICQMSLVMHGKVKWAEIVTHTEKFCSTVLERPVKIVED